MVEHRERVKQAFFLVWALAVLVNWIAPDTPLWDGAAAALLVALLLLLIAF